MSAEIIEFVPQPHGLRRHKVGAQVIQFPAAHQQARRERVFDRYAGLQDMINTARAAQKGVDGK